MVTLSHFEDSLNDELKNPEFAANYLQAALDDGGIEEFLFAIRDIAKANEGGVSRIAKKCAKGRESFYKSFSRKGNPGIRAVNNVLQSLGLRLNVAVSVKPSLDPILKTPE